MADGGEGSPNSHGQPAPPAAGSTGAPAEAPPAAPPAAPEGQAAAPAAAEVPQGGEEYWFSEDEEGEEWEEDEFEEYDNEDDLDDLDDFDEDDEQEFEEAWDEGDPDDGWMSEGSLPDEPGDAAVMATELAQDTDGSLVWSDCTSYAVPTTSHHFQSADALAVMPLPASAGGGLLAAVFDREGVAVWRLPRAGDVRHLGRSEAAVRLGGFQAPCDLYTMALSPDGRYLAAAGDGGLLTIYSIDPSAPPRPDVAPCRLEFEGLNYFYMPLMVPQPLPLRPRQVLEQEQQQLQRHRQQQVGGDIATQDDGQQQAEQQPAAASQQSPEGALGPAAGSPAALAARGIQLPPIVHQVVPAEYLDMLFSEDPSPRISKARILWGMVHLVSSALAAAASPNDETAYRRFKTELELRLQGKPLEQQMDEIWQAGQLYEAFSRQAFGNLEQTLAEDEQEEEQQLDAAAGAGPAAAAGQRPPGPASSPEDKGTASQGGSTDSSMAAAAAAAQVPVWQGSQEGTRAAVMLRGVLAPGMGPWQARQLSHLRDGMCNGLRFGLVAGRQRLLAADQSCYVYVFELPDASSAPGSSSSSSFDGGANLRAEQLMCSSLGQTSPHWCMRPVKFFGATQHMMGARLRQQHPPQPAAAAQAGNEKAAAGSFMTATVGPFPCPTNLAAASPDGRWIAVVGDTAVVFLVDQQAGFAWRQLPFVVAGELPPPVAPAMETGAQYVAWNASSSLLAATSDVLRAAFVFEPAGGQLLLRVELHFRPCLSVTFAPWDDRLLVYGEDFDHIHLRKVPEAVPPSQAVQAAAGTGQEAGGEAAAAPERAWIDRSRIDSVLDDLAMSQGDVQLLRLPDVPPVVSAANFFRPRRRQRVTGMACTADGDLLVTTRQGTLLRFFSSRAWRLEQHAGWPPAFRAAAQTLLLCAHRQHKLAAADGRGSGEAGLWVLPQPLLVHIVSLAAGSRLDWMLPNELAAAEGAAAAQAVQAAAGVLAG